MKELLVVLIVTIILIITFFILKSHFFKQGYECGTWHTILHLQATGYVPSMAWRETHRNDDIQTSEQLLDLSPEITFTSGDPCITLGRK